MIPKLINLAACHLLYIHFTLNETFTIDYLPAFYSHIRAHLYQLKEVSD